VRWISLQSCNAVKLDVRPVTRSAVFMVECLCPAAFNVANSVLIDRASQNFSVMDPGFCVGT